MATATPLLAYNLSTLLTAKGRLEMNLNLKRVLPSDASKRSNLDPRKRQCQKLSSAEMCESDVSLSDYDGDELAILSRNMRVQSSKSDGKVSIPVPSTIFLKLTEQRIRQNEVAKAILAATGTVPGRPLRTASATLHSSVQSHALSDFERMRSQQASTIYKTVSKDIKAKITIPTNAILNAHCGDDTTNLGINKRHVKDLHMVGSILLSSNRLIRNSALSQNSSNSLIKGQQMGKQVINLKTGNAVLDKIHFSKSCNRCGNVDMVQSNEKENIRRDQKAQKESAELLEIQQLLGKKSSHAEERELEWFDSFDKRTSKLAAKEENLKKMAQVVNSFARAYYCQDCKVITESDLAVQLCSQKEHTVIKVKAIKWFFECAVCKRRDSTLSIAPTGEAAAYHTGQSTGKGNPNDNRIKFNPNALPDKELVSGMSSKQHPTRRCDCGGFNWRSCSKYGSNEGTSIKSDQRIILSASEWTSRKDLASLDAMRSSIL